MKMKLLIVFALLSLCAATEVESMIDSYLDIDLHASSDNQDQVRFNELTNLLAEASSGNYTTEDIEKVKTILVQMHSKIDLEGLKEQHALDVLLTEKKIWKEKYSIDIDQYTQLIAEEKQIFAQREANTKALLDLISEIEALIAQLKSKAKDLADRASEAGQIPTKPQIGLTEQYPGKNCQHILQAGTSDEDGVFWIDPNFEDSIPPFQAWCDMTSFDGGWTLLISMAQDGLAAATPAEWPRTFAKTGQAPLVTGLYNGPMDSFSEVREELASGKLTFFGSNMTQTDFATIRAQYGYTSRLQVSNLRERPMCRSTYERIPASEIPGCTTTNPNAPASELTTTNQVVGWATNPAQYNQCAFAAGLASTGGGRRSLLAEEQLGGTGALQCPGLANGSHWSRVWFR